MEDPGINRSENLIFKKKKKKQALVDTHNLTQGRGIKYFLKSSTAKS